MISDTELVRDMRIVMVMLDNAIPVVLAGKHEPPDRDAWAFTLDKLANDLRDGDGVVIDGESPRHRVSQSATTGYDRSLLTLRRVLDGLHRL